MTCDLEYQTNFINKYGIVEICDARPSVLTSDTTEINEEDYANIKTGDLVYVITTALPMWFQHIYPRLVRDKISIFLVTGDSVSSAPLAVFSSGPAGLDSLFDAGVIRHWFAQNCDIMGHPKVTPIPLGIDFHTRHNRVLEGEALQSPDLQDQQLTALTAEQRSSEAWYRKRPELFVDIQYSLAPNPLDRSEALLAAGSLRATFKTEERLTRQSYWELMREFRFVLSPLGKGVDCHRTWEALALGAVPIIKRTAISSLFDGLPVWQVGAYTEINDERLAAFAYPVDISPEAIARLTLKFWQDVIQRTRSGH